jgi:hypothetical protein
VPDLLDKRIAERERENAGSGKRAERAEALVEVQQNIAAAGDATRERAILMAAVTEVGPRLGIAPTCAALGVPRATY